MLLAMVTLTGAVTGVTNASNNSKPLYRFWHRFTNAHFFTVDEAEKDYVIQNWSAWYAYEGTPMNCFDTTSSLTGLGDVHRFWRHDGLNEHFYTIDEGEKDWLIANYSHIYTYEGVQFRAYPPDYQPRPANAKPVYRLWHPTQGVHFYTLDQAEYDNCLNWGFTYECIAWYAFDIPVSSGSVKVHTSSAYNSYGTNSQLGLTDCQVHFGAQDGSGTYAFPNVYLQISATGGSTLVPDEVCFWVGTGTPWGNMIEAKFLETGSNTGVYHIMQPLHVAPQGNQANHEIQIVNEETVYVDGVPGPKLDRGEVATITGSVEPVVPQDTADASADAIDHSFDKDDSGHNGTCYWWECGQLRATSGSSFSSFVKGCGTLQPPADLVMGNAHGGGGYIDGLYAPGLSTPAIEATEWDEDIDWAILYACMLFGERDYIQGQWPNYWFGPGSPSAFVTYWDDALIRPGASYCHGILGSSAVLWASTSSDNYALMHMQKFVDLAKTNTTSIVNAYMTSALDSSLTPFEQWGASALFRNSNVNDCLNKVWPDAANTLMYYTWYETVGSGTRSTSTFADADKPVVTSDENEAVVMCAIPTERPELSKILAHREPIAPRTFGPTVFSQEPDRFGRLRWSDTPVPEADAETFVEESTAQTIARNFVAQMAGGLPQDAEVKEVRRRYVMTYDAEAPEATVEAHVHTMFVEYGHSYNGIDIVTGGRGDQIRVAIAEDRVVDVIRYWREIEGPAGPADQVISAADALETAIDNIRKVIALPPEKDCRITNIRLFYYGLPSPDAVHVLTPAWGFEVENTLWVYVDAFTGEFLDQLAL